MSETYDTLVQEALVLSADERLAMAHRLLESVDLESKTGAEEAWEEEITDRIAKYRRGESPTISASEVFARLRQIAPGK